KRRYNKTHVLPAPVVYIVPESNRVLLLPQAGLFFDLYPVYKKTPYRRVLKGEFRQKPVSFLPAAVREVLRGQDHPVIWIFQRLRQTVDHVPPVIRRLQAGHQKRVVSPRRGSGHRKRRIAAQTVRHQITVLLSPDKSFPVMSAVDPFYTHTLHSFLSLCSLYSSKDQHTLR